MSFLKSIKSAFGGSDGEEYDVFGQPTSFVNPFSKDKNVPNHDAGGDTIKVQVEKDEEYAIDAEFADKAARLMSEHTQAVTEMIQQAWAKERKELEAMAGDAQKIIDGYKEKIKVLEAGKVQAQHRNSELMEKVAELESAHEKLDIEKKSLESRIKAMEVRGEGADDLNKKLEEMTATLEDLQQQIAAKDAELERLNGIVMSSQDGPSVEELQQQLGQRDELVEQLRANVEELEGRCNSAAEELKAAEETISQVEEFKDKKNAEISSLRQQVNELRDTASQYDQLRKEHIVIKDENEAQRKAIEQLEQSAKQNAEVQNRRSIETGNLIDGLKQQLASVSAMAEDYKRKYNSLSVDGNEKAANFAKITAERDDAKAELRRTQVTLQKKQHEAQAMNDAIAERDRRIAALEEQIKELSQARPVADAPSFNQAAPLGDSSMPAIDDIDWEDDGSMPPHPGEDPRQLTLF